MGSVVVLDGRAGQCVRVVLLVLSAVSIIVSVYLLEFSCDGVDGLSCGEKCIKTSDGCGLYIWVINKMVINRLERIRQVDDQQTARSYKMFVQFK